MSKETNDITLDEHLDEIFKKYNIPSLRNDILITKEKIGYEFNTQQKEYTKKLLGYIIEQANRKEKQNPEYIDKVNDLVDKAKIYLGRFNSIKII